jgi:hypothetical protein
LLTCRSLAPDGTLVEAVAVSLISARTDRAGCQAGVIYREGFSTSFATVMNARIFYSIARRTGETADGFLALVKTTDALLKRIFQ